MKIRTHFVVGKRVACGKKKVFTTTNFREITCKACLKTHSHKGVAAAVATA